jgi:hypothetical protein
MPRSSAASPSGANDPNRTSVNCPPLTVLRPFHVDGISRMQHLFLCLKGARGGNSATVSIIPRED